VFQKRAIYDEALENSDGEGDEGEEEPTGPPITRATFISPNHIASALSQKTMYQLAENGEGVKEVPIPKSLRKRGVIPEGYSIGAYSCLHMTAIISKGLMMGVQG